MDSEGNPLPADSSSATRGGRGGSSNRGSARGRGRGGAGGMAWNSMKLDNRTTRLQVKGLKKEEEGKREKAKEHFKVSTEYFSLKSVMLLAPLFGRNMRESIADFLIPTALSLSI